LTLPLFGTSVLSTRILLAVDVMSGAELLVLAATVDAATLAVPMLVVAETVSQLTPAVAVTAVA
jgi:hypothetical protein